MIYRVIGAMSGSSQEGLHMIFAELTETGGKWAHEIIAAGNYPYGSAWSEKLKSAVNNSVAEHQQLHRAFGKYLGEQVNQFIESNDLNHRVHLVVSQGYSITTLPGTSGVAQLGHGAFIAAATKLPVVCELYALDTAFGGQGVSPSAVAAKLLPGEEILPGYQEVLGIALMGALRWREEANMLATATGASQNSIGGALWLGTDA